MTTIVDFPDRRVKLRIAAVSVVVLIHHAVAFVHGGAHDELAIPMAAWQTVFINVVIVAVPLAGTALMWTRYRRIGLCAVVFGMLGALVFGIAHHYMIVSPDHIAHLPHGASGTYATFQWTAGAIAMLEGFAAILAAYVLGTHRPDSL